MLCIYYGKLHVGTLRGTLLQVRVYVHHSRTWRIRCCCCTCSLLFVCAQAPVADAEEARDRAPSRLGRRLGRVTHDTCDGGRERMENRNRALPRPARSTYGEPAWLVSLFLCTAYVHRSDLWRLLRGYIEDGDEAKVIFSPPPLGLYTRRAPSAAAAAARYSLAAVCSGETLSLARAAAAAATAGSRLPMPRDLTWRTRDPFFSSRARARLF